MRFYLRALAILFSAVGVVCSSHGADAPSAESNAAMIPDATFLNTRWRAVEVDGTRVTLSADQREPYIRLMLDGNRMEGWAGCNRLSGAFEDDANGFRFIGIATTLMMCGGDVAAFEKRYIKALNEATSRKVVGETLELRDADDTVRVRFEALYLN